MHGALPKHMKQRRPTTTYANDSESNKSYENARRLISKMTILSLSGVFRGGTPPSVLRMKQLKNEYNLKTTIKFPPPPPPPPLVKIVTVYKVFSVCQTKVSDLKWTAPPNFRIGPEANCPPPPLFVYHL